MSVATILAALVGALAPAPADAPTTTTAIEPAPAAEPTIVLVAVDGPEAAERAEAVSAHVHGSVALATSDARPATDEPRAWYELAVREAERAGAFAVLWVDVEDDGQLVLSVVRPGVREIRWRRIATDPAAPSAGLEALGVVARATTSALLSDGALQMETTPIEEAPAPPAAAPPRPTTTPTTKPAPPAKRERGRGLLAVGYVGTSYAREIPWQSGVGFEGGFAWPFGLHATVGYTLYQRARAESPWGRIEVVRNPITAMLGYHRRWRALGYGGDGGVIVDVAQRRASTSATGVAAADDRVHVGTALALRARGSVVAVWRLEVFVAIGLEVWLSQVEYGIESPTGDTDVVLEPHRVRGTATAGVAVRL